ncbi:MAG: hypothetical protein RIE06_27515 [Roseibium album]|uniref:hypothetical protein n=1 Tax=Roseibium album TaxID=311410 RepID=UPI0032EC7495
MSTQPDWLAIAAASGLTVDEARRERAQREFEDAAMALHRQLGKLRQEARRLREDDDAA